MQAADIFLDEQDEEMLRKPRRMNKAMRRDMQKRERLKLLQKRLELEERKVGIADKTAKIEEKKVASLHNVTLTFQKFIEDSRRRYTEN